MYSFHVYIFHFIKHFFQNLAMLPTEFTVSLILMKPNKGNVRIKVLSV